MSTYIILGNYTEKGIASMKDSPKRLDAGRQAAKGMGVDLKEFYLTMGGHDFVAIADASSDEAMAKFILALGARGNVRTTTLKAFTESQYRNIVASLP
jgi:uncharacterized protein with GYD domain